MRTLIGINILTSIQAYAYASHCQFWYRLGRIYPEDQFIFMTPPRMSIDRMRNECARIALEQECDYLMFIDDDVVIPYTAYRDLMTMNYDIAAGFVVIRGYPFNVMLFKETYDDNGILRLPYYNDYVDDIKDNILKCGAVGFSCVLIKCSLLKELTLPYFMTGTQQTEDIYFCLKARKEVPGITIGANFNVQCGHLGEPRIYTPDNRLLYKKMDEELNPSLIVPESTGDHNVEYVEKCLSSLV